MSAAMDRRSEQVFRQMFPELFKRLTKEQVADFVELAEIFASSRDPEVLETMVEVLSPESLEVVFESGVDEAAASQLDEYQKKIGEQIKNERVQRGWTQEFLAERAGLKQSHISRLELGVYTPSDLTIKKIADALDIPPDKLDPGLNPEKLS